VSESFVVDASIAVAWVHPAQATPQTDLLLDRLAEGIALEVPALWPLEVSNALVVLERRRKLTKREREEAISAVQKLAVKIDHEMANRAFTTLSELALEHQLSVYDAAYLELARRKRLALACKDGPLRAAAERAKVKVI